MPKEQLLQSNILAHLRAKGYFAVKINTAGIYVKGRDTYIPNPNKGCPDILAWRKGISVAVECKSKYGKQSPEQIEWQNNFEKQGCKYILAKDVDDIKELY